MRLPRQRLTSMQQAKALLVVLAGTAKVFLYHRAHLQLSNLLVSLRLSNARCVAVTPALRYLGARRRHAGAARYEHGVVSERGDRFNGLLMQIPQNVDPIIVGKPSFSFQA